MKYWEILTLSQDNHLRLKCAKFGSLRVITPYANEKKKAYMTEFAICCNCEAHKLKKMKKIVSFDDQLVIETAIEKRSNELERIANV